MENYNNGDYQSGGNWQAQDNWQNQNNWQEQNQQNYQNQYNYQNGSGYPGGAGWGMTSAQRALKDGGSSACFLVGAIFYTLSVLISLYLGLSGGGSTLDLEGIVFIVYLLAMVPSVLICIGMWMFYSTCRKNGPLQITGLSLARGGLIAILVILSVCCAICAGVVMWGVSEANRLSGGNLGYYYRSAYVREQNLIIFLIVILIIVAVLTIVYFVKAIGTASAVINICRNGWPHKKLSMYLIVMNFILLGLSVLMVLFSIMGSRTLGVRLDGISIIQNLSGMGAMLCVTISILQLRSRLISGR